MEIKKKDKKKTTNVLKGLTILPNVYLQFAQQGLVPVAEDHSADHCFTGGFQMEHLLGAKVFNIQASCEPVRLWWYRGQ